MKIYWIVILCIYLTQLACSDPTKSNGNGNNFDPRNISRNSGSSFGAGIEVDVLDGLHVVWHDDTPGSWEILYSTKPSGGSWATPVDISNSPYTSIGADIAMDLSGTIHLVWEENLPVGYDQIFYTMKTNGGNWLTSVNISNSNDFAEQAHIEIETNGDVHVIWTGGGAEGGLWYSTKLSGGSWSIPIKFVPFGVGPINPSLAVEPNGNVHVVSEGFSDEIIYTTKPLGDTWSQPKNISNKPGYSWAPDITVNPSGDVHVVWFEVFEGVAYYTGKPAGDTLFNSPVSLPSVLGQPEITVDSDKTLHLVWDVGGEIYYSKKPDGNNWSSSINISNTVGNSNINHAPYSKAGIIHFVWQDDTPGNYEVYYDVLP